jgi:hypothetical protein
MRGPVTGPQPIGGGPLHFRRSPGGNPARLVRRLHAKPLKGISPSSVGRIWAEAGLKPHIIKGFKVSNDPMF